MRDKVRQQEREELHIIFGKCEQIFQNSLPDCVWKRFVKQRCTISQQSDAAW
jgi:hypothetical protein